MIVLLLANSKIFAGYFLSFMLERAARWIFSVAV